jgi:ribonuclease P protein component
LSQSPAPRVSVSFPQQARLLRTADYRRVYDEGSRRQFGWMAVFLLRTGNHQARVGITVPRAFGGAVERNRMKRRLRHAIAACMDQLPAGWDIVLHPRAAGLKLEFTEMQATLRKVFAFCARRVPE